MISFFQSLRKRTQKIYLNLKTGKFNECMEPKFSVHVIKQHLEKLNTSKAIGADMVHPKVLKSCSAELAYPLSKIFEKSFETGSLPEMWLKAKNTIVQKR